MNPVSPVGIAAKALATQSTQAKPVVGDVSGKNLFAGLLEKTNEQQNVSDQAIKDLAEGKAESVQQVVLAVAEAEMSFQLFMEIRNKLIDSYNELMRMQF